VSYCLGRWQEFAFIFNELTVTNSGRVGLLVLNTLNHLVQVKGYRQLLSRVSISIHNEEITFFILSPKSSLIQVDRVHTRSSLNRHTEQLEEVVIIVDTKFFLVTYLVEVSTLSGGNYNNFSVLSDLNYRVIISANQVDQTTAEAVVATEFLFLQVSLDSSLIG